LIAYRLDMKKKKVQKPEKKVDILFTGLVRTPDMLKKSIYEMSELRKEGIVDNIIFSTWKGEIQKYPEVYEFFKKNRVKILENEEPEEAGLAHIFHQMKALDMGLKYINKNKFVLKIRSDMYIEKKFLKRLFLEKNNLLKIKKDLPKGNIFKYKIWVHFFELKTPFLIGDCGFFGYNEDLKKLVNYEKSYDTKYKIITVSHIEHIRRFVHPFLEDYPIFKETVKKHVKIGYFRTILLRFFLKFFSMKFLSLKKIRLISKFNQESNYFIIKNKLKDNSYIESLAAYYSILYSHFYVDSNSIENLIILRGFDEVPQWKIDTKNFENNFSRDSIRKTGLDLSYVYDMEFLGNIFNEKLEKTELSNRLIKAVNKFFNT